MAQKKHTSRFKKTVVLAIVLSYVLGLTFPASFFVPVAQAAGATRTWDGGGADNNATTAANWSSDTAPTAGDLVVFDSTSTKNCTWNISAATTFASFSINSGYTGTISLSNSLTMTGAYTQATGTLTFNAASVVVTAGENSTVSGGTINHSQEPNGSGTTAARQVKFAVTGDFNIQSGASVNVNSLGFVNAQGPSVGTSGSYDYGGGGNGGDGGSGNTTTGGTSGIGSVSLPVTAGSGGQGATGGGWSPGYGGGVVNITASGTLTVGGNITANGGNGALGSGNNGVAGGAGGSIYLSAGTLAGSGSITANGGAAAVSGGAYVGGGGGGKIAFAYTSKTHNGSVTAYGGAPANAGTYGAAGTIYDNGALTIDNNSSTTTRQTRSVSGTTTVTNFTLKNRGQYTILTGTTTTVSTGFTNGSSTSTLTVNSGGTLDISTASNSGAPNITVNGTVTYPSTLAWSQNTFTQNVAVSSGLSGFNISGGTFVMGASLPSISSFTMSGGTFKFASSNTLTLSNAPTLTGGTFSQSQEPNGSGTTATYGVRINVTGDFNLQSGASVNVSSLGFVSAQGPAVGTSGSYDCGGGGNGGDGGNGSGTTGGVSGIGSVSAPVTAGSGGQCTGGSWNGGYGGGVVNITASGTLTVGGTITANGQTPGVGSGNGGAAGGAGGSIYLSAGTLAGSGSITANGGNGTVTGGAAVGGGGGGKIAFVYSSKTHNGSVTAYGGAPVNSGTYGAAGTIYDNGALTVNNNSSTTTRQTRLPASSYSNITTSNKGQITLVGNVTASGNVTIGSGTTVAPSSYTLTVGGNFANSGTFTAGTSTVVFNTAATSAISGSTTFYNLSSTTAGKNLTFTAGTTQTISNALTLTGTAGSYVTLRSSSTGSYWNINPQGTRSVSYVDVKDSNNTNATAITATNTLDSGHNSNWTISGPPPTDPVINNYNNGAYTSDATPTLSFDLTDPQSLSVKYRVQIDDTSDFSSAIVDETEGSYVASPRSNVTYTPSALSDGSYYWRVMALNSNSQSSSWTTANSGSVAFRVDATAPSAPSISINAGDTYTTSTSVALTLSATDAASGLADMMVSENADFSDASWESYATSKAFTLSLAHGTKTVYAKFRDAAGNESASTSDTIVYDATAPTGAISLDSDAVYAASTSVTVGIIASDATAGMYQMQISENADFSGASWENYATSKVVTLTGLDGTKTYYARFKDNAGNISLGVSDDIILDTTAPAGGTISINAGDAYANAVSATLALSATDATSGVYQMQVSEDSGFLGASWEAYNTSKAFTLSSGNGTKTVYVRFQDNTGNVSSDVSDSIVLDTVRPALTDFTINGDASYTTSNSVTLTIGGVDATSGITDMMIAESAGFVGASWESFATSKAFSASVGDGNKTIYIKLRDAAGNVSLPTFDTITLDSENPDGSILIDDGAGYATTQGVTLTLDATDNIGPIAQMRVSEDNTFTGVSFEAYGATKSFTLSSGDGTKTVYVEYKDDAGNVSAVSSDSITLDETNPGSLSITINAGALDTNDRNVDLTLSASDATSGVEDMMISESASFAGAAWEDFSSPTTVALSETNGTKTLYFKVRDAAGNVSATESDTILLDTTPPTGSVVVQAGASYVNGTTVTVTIAGTDEESVLSEMMVSNASNFAGASWEPFATTKSWTLTTGDGTKTVYVKFRDSLSNTSTAVTDSVVLDTTAPTGSVVINDGSSSTSSQNVVLTIAASDASGSGLASMKVSEDPTFAGVSVESYATTKEFSLSAGYGSKTVYVEFIDTIGNTSGTFPDSITYAAPAAQGSTNSSKPTVLSDQTKATGASAQDAAPIGQLDTDADADVDSAGSPVDTNTDTTANTYTIVLRIVGDDNLPVAGARVTLEDGRVGVTDEQGIVVFEGVDKGKTKAAVEFDGKTVEQYIDVAGESAQVPVTIELKNGFSNSAKAAVASALVIVVGVGLYAAVRVRKSRLKRTSRT